MNIDNGLAQRLKELRKKAGLTQEELAELIDVHLNTISRWENGIDTPKTFKITQLAKVLNVNEVELINGTPSQNWELKLLVSKTRENEGGTVDMSGKSSTATLSVGDDAMAITMSADYSLWEDEAKFEGLIEDLRRKRLLGLKMRKESW